MPWMNVINELRDAITEKVGPYPDVKTFIAEQFRPAFLHELPLVSFYFGEERITDNDSQPIIRDHSLPVNFDICRSVDQEEGLDPWLYERAFEIIQAVDSSNYLGKEYVDRLVLTGTVPGDIPAGTEDQIRVLRVVYEIRFKTTIQPFGSLDGFLRFRNKIQTTDGAESEDHVTIREA